MKSEAEKVKNPVAMEPGHMSELHPLVNRNLYLYEVRIERNKEFVVAQTDGSLQLQVGCQRYRDLGQESTDRQWVLAGPPLKKLPGRLVRADQLFGL